MRKKFIFRTIKTARENQKPAPQLIDNDARSVLDVGVRKSKILFEVIKLIGEVDLVFGRVDKADEFFPEFASYQLRIGGDLLDGR